MNLKSILSTFIMFVSCSIYGQTVFSVDSKYDADVKIFVTSSKYDADLVVFKCSSKYDAVTRIAEILEFANSAYHASSEFQGSK